MSGTPLTVVQVLPDLTSGGVERGTVELAEHLVREGHRAIVISAAGPMVDQLTDAGAEHVDWPIGRKSPMTLRFIPKLRRLLREQRVEILHARSRVPAWVCYLAWRGMPRDTRPRFVTTVHGLYSVSRFSRVMTFGEKVVAVSQTAAEYVKANYPLEDPDRLVMIPRGVDPEAFAFGYEPSDDWCATWYTEHPELRDRPVITMIGRITRLKGHADFIELFTRLRDHGSDAMGLIVGGEDPRRADYARELRDLVAKRDLRNVIFAGHRHDVREILAVSDVLVSLSTQPESFGRTVLEALTLGRPVIGYDHGGVGEVLGRLYPDGRVPLRDLDALTDRVLQFLESPPPAPRGHDLTLRRMLDRTIRLYHDLTA